jgi:hypothetical protein
MKEGAINFAPSFYLILQTKKPRNVGLENYNKIESALNNYDPTPLV